MKYIMTTIAAISLATSISFTAHANTTGGGATQAGPLVNCTHSDGKKTYVPTMICTYSGGKFVRNWGNQF